MSVRNSSGTVMTKTALKAAMSSSTVTSYTVPAETFFYLAKPLDGEENFEEGRRLFLRPGQVVTSAYIDGFFPTATFTSITPATGTTAGGTAVTIVGTNFAGVTGGTLGGSALTSVVVVDDNTITAVSPAHAGGAVDLVLTDDNANVTATGAYTYA